MILNWRCDCKCYYEMDNIVEKNYEEVIIKVICPNCGNSDIAVYKFERIGE